MLPVIAIVGRPNVGKSTLFNRLIGSRQALVDDRPGVTRDRNYGTTHINDREIMLIDTGGFEPIPEDELFAKIRVQAEAAIQEADVILLVVDIRAGMTPADRMTGELLRRMGALDRVILIINKCDGPQQDALADDFWELGLENMITLSAEHGRGVYELHDAITERLPEPVEGEGAEPEEDPDNPEIRIAVIGRPNIGKSTLVNRMIGEDRHVVHDQPGTTMDAVDSVFEEDGRRWRIVDTAGIRRRARIDERLEVVAVTRAIKAIERCHVTLLMIDGMEGLTGQDARLAALAADRGRAVVLLINRWDLARNNPEVSSKDIGEQVETTMPHLSWAPHLFISALTGKGCHRILPTILRIYEQFDKRISTAELNRWLDATVTAHPPPQKHHHKVRMNYITQHRVRPPSFIIFGNSPDAVAPPYVRYLENRLREAYGFEGTPIRIKLKRKRKPGEAQEAS
jgi:GTP-binding protein